MAACRYTLIFYESPRRVENFLRVAHSVLGNRRFCLGKEISKKHEKMIRGELGVLDAVLKTETILGEVVVILEGAVSKMTESEKPEIRSREDLFSFFKTRYGISKNTIKKALMER
jgi:16S rRNA (cytidine1402-2'-O)-methyltransferase